MTIQHQNISDPYIHEPKGASDALVQQVYVADGAGSGTWEKVHIQSLEGISANGDVYARVVADGSGGFTLLRNAHGAVTFQNIASPYTWAYSATFTKIAPTTVAGGSSILVTEATTARLTYTGTETRAARATCLISIKQTSGGAKDLRFALGLNGTVSSTSTIVITSNTAEWHPLVTTLWLPSLQTNDYIEAFMQNDGGSGDVSIGTFKLILETR